MTGSMNNYFITPYLYCWPFPIRGICELKVDGRGSVMAKPDTAVSVVGVFTENMQLETAQQENAVKITSVIQAIRQEGIPAEDIQTQTYNIEPMYDYIDGKQVFRGYKVTHNLRVTIKNVEKVGRVIDAAVKAGANTVNGINFTVKNPSVFYREALNEAINDAVLKAIDVGSSLNVKINQIPIQVIEESYQQSPQVMTYQMQSQIAGTPIQPGQIEITALIKAVFVYMV